MHVKFFHFAWWTLLHCDLRNAAILWYINRGAYRDELKGADVCSVILGAKSLHERSLHIFFLLHKCF